MQKIRRRIASSRFRLTPEVAAELREEIKESMLEGSPIATALYDQIVFSHFFNCFTEQKELLRFFNGFSGKDRGLVEELKRQTLEITRKKRKRIKEFPNFSIELVAKIPDEQVTEAAQLVKTHTAKLSSKTIAEFEKTALNPITARSIWGSTYGNSLKWLARTFGVLLSVKGISLE